jgi:glycerol-3-phosphate O-acyltransferase
MPLRAVPDPDGGWPDAAGHPVCFLVDARGSLEQRLVDQWMRAHRPADAPFTVLRLPASKGRSRGRRRALTAIADLLERGGDPLMTPLRVAWLAPVGRKRRVPRLLGLLTLGDPRDPNRLLQELIIRFRPDRVRVVAGEPATVSDLRRRWDRSGDGRTRLPDGFAEFVFLQGALALEVAERRLQGNRYKVPRFLAEDLLSSLSFRSGLADLARSTGEDLEDVSVRATRYLREIAATPSTFVLDLVAALIRIVYTRGYHHRIQYDADALERIASLGREHSLAFLPSHKSNMDHLALTYVLYENGMPPNHAAGGENMNFFPVGPLLRRHGIFFIRRSFRDNAVYKYVFKSYIGYLLAKRFPLEWYIEGGRSRSGKLREPRFGMLSYVSEAWRHGVCEDVILVPTSIAYDQIQDVGAHAAEQRGSAKEKESFGWMVRALSTLSKRYGRIYINFGEPISLAETLGRGEGDGDPATTEDDLEMAKLAFEVAVRINRATPITPISLVALALLGAGGRALTAAETHEALRDYIDFVERRSLPVTKRLALDDQAAVAAALDSLVEHGVVGRFDKGPEVVYSIGSDQHLAAAFYRNTIIHFFTTGAIVELALVRAADAVGDRTAAFWDAVWDLRDLLKFEFFFAERDEFEAEVDAEVAFHVAGWRDALAGERDDVLGVLESFSPFSAHAVLRPILEAYLVVAEALVDRDFRLDVDRDELVAACLDLGTQYTLQRRINSPEAVSTVLFDSAVRLADNRGLLGGGGVERLREREAFADEIRRAVEAVGVVEDTALRPR